MKKMISVILALVMCMTLGVSALAAAPTVGEWSDRVVLNDEQREAFQTMKVAQQLDSSNENKSTPYGPTGVAGVYIEEIYGYPLLMEAETGELFYVPGIGTGGELPNKSQSESLRLSTEQANSLYQRVLSYAAANGKEGYHYSVAGWFIETKVATRADYPMYIKYHAGEPNFGIGAEEQNVNIPYTMASLKVGLPLPFPDNYSETEYYHIDGIEGTFTYRAAFNNRILSIPFSAGMAFNWKGR